MERNSKNKYNFISRLRRKSFNDASEEDQKAFEEWFFGHFFLERETRYVEKDRRLYDFWYKNIRNK